MPVTIHPLQFMTDHQFLVFSRSNRPLRLEREVNGDLVIRIPTGSEVSAIIAEIGV
ncbi:hypothetical protein [Terriglobus sp.]|uniref:hypothetical protein n=1 Tax=Terriglobus sp. TaxID=1889013 RepID=UPI003B00C347